MEAEAVVSAGGAALGSTDQRMTIWRGGVAMRLLKMLLALYMCAAGPAVAGPYEDATGGYQKGD